MLSTFTGSASQTVVSSVTEKAIASSKLDTEKATDLEISQNTAGSSSSDNEGEPELLGLKPRVTLLIRPQTGTTKSLLAQTRAAGGKISIPVYIESSYHANPATRELTHCSTLIGIAGGVGITAVLPIARTFGGLRSRIWWGAKHNDIVRAVQPELKQLRASIEVETTIGTRLPVMDIIRDELMREDEKGNLGVVVCGPPSMADDVRQAIGELAGSGQAKRGVVFIDEAFSW